MGYSDILDKNKEYPNQHPSATHARGLVASRADVACFSRTSPPSTPHFGTHSCTVLTTQNDTFTSCALHNGR